MTKRAGRHNKSPRKRRQSREYHHGGNVIVQRVTERIVGSSAIATGQTTSGNAEEQCGEERDSFFWPKLNQSTVEAAIAAGRGDCVKSLQDVRIELKAIQRNYNIPHGLKARMVFEAVKLMIYSKVAKEKIWAIKLLKAMEDSNHRPRVLPAQVTVSNTFSVNALLKEFGKELMDPSMDFRAVKAFPGSAEDYAD